MSQERISTKRMYYIGSDVLREGYLLCYQQHPDQETQDLARGYDVEKPAQDNLKYFAGVVGPEDAGKAGPCWISLIEPQPNPGRLVMLHTDQNCILGTTRLAASAGSYAAGAVGASSVAVATAMQTANRSGTAGTVLAQLEGTRPVTETKHTPTPWILEPKKNWRKVIRIEQPGDGYHRLYIEVCRDDCCVETAEANARFTERACNAHDALVAACEAAEIKILAFREELEIKEGEAIADATTRDELEQLRAALRLAKPEGGPHA